jgi:hypothetical protein
VAGRELFLTRRATPHNIGLQRTSACGLAAEAGSFGLTQR